MFRELRRKAHSQRNQVAAEQDDIQNSEHGNSRRGNHPIEGRAA